MSSIQILPLSHQIKGEGVKGRSSIFFFETRVKKYFHRTLFLKVKKSTNKMRRTGGVSFVIQSDLSQKKRRRYLIQTGNLEHSSGREESNCNIGEGQ